MPPNKAALLIQQGVLTEKQAQQVVVSNVQRTYRCSLCRQVKKGHVCTGFSWQTPKDDPITTLANASQALVSRPSEAAAASTNSA